MTIPCCEIITIGTELLLGQILDTNTQYLSQRLVETGIDVKYKTSVGDNMEDIIEVIKIAKNRSDFILTTGGLGPTLDDLTRDAIAKVAKVRLEFREELLDQIKEVFDRLGYTMTENNKRQAFIPEGSIPIPNSLGTAPGFIKEIDGTPVICLPGVPRELKYLMENQIIPWLRKKYSLNKEIIYYKVLKVVGTGESKVDRLIGDIIRQTENPEIGLLASAGEIKVRVVAKAKDKKEAELLINPVVNKIKERLGKKIYGEDSDLFEDVVSKLLEKKGLTLSILETFSGGKAAQKLILAPCQSLLETRIINNKELLGQMIDKEISSVNKEISFDLAKKIRDISKAKIGLSIIGFPVKKGSDFLVRACASVVGDNIKSSYIWTMGGDLSFIQERGAIIGLNTLRLALIN